MFQKSENLMKRVEPDSKEIKGLAPAGAGLPAAKVFLARNIMFPLLRRTVSFQKAVDIFESQGRIIVSLSEPLSEETLFERVMVPPLFGLEENSRYYSVAMVLKHLLTVGEALKNRIPALSREEVPEKEVHIEDFKPYGDMEEDIVERYSRFIEGFKKSLVENLADIDSPATYAHPWFGELDVKGWMVMGMVHQIVHRRQIEAILALFHKIYMV